MHISFNIVHIITMSVLITILLVHNIMPYFENRRIEIKSINKHRVYPAYPSVSPLSNRYSLPHCDGIRLDPDDCLPLVYVVLNYRLSFILKTIPFICKFNNRVVLLTNSQFDEFWNSTCVEVVDISTFYTTANQDFYFPPNMEHQKIFFTRWFVLCHWMHATGTHQIMTMDSDSIIFKNMTSMVLENPNVFCRSSLWLIYQPPRASMGFLMITLSALVDVTDFWKKMLQPDIWSPEFITSNEPNDMVAMGHYMHTAIGHPYPCWGLGRWNASYLDSPGTCNDYNAYAWTTILDRLRDKGVTAVFKPEALNLYPNNSTNGSILGGLPGAFDVNFEHDDPGTYTMRAHPTSRTGRYKVLRYISGTPQLKLANGEWGELFGLILEDFLEGCVDMHVKLATEKGDCNCGGPCCDTCEPSEDVQPRPI